MKKAFLIILLGWGALFISIPVWAGVTGKIAGKIMDKSTGEPLPGANILIEETVFGAASNVEGDYYILNVPPSTYSIKASMMGYKPIIKKEVRISVDLTTTINFELEPTAIEVEEVSVIAKRPMVIPDATATTRVVDAKQIDRQAVHTQRDVLAQQAGVVDSPGGASGATGGIHIRGGRTDEVVYMVDGMSINDPISGGAAANVSMTAVKEMSVTTGGFNAEYGQAMSGLVNLVTKEGRKFEGLLRTQSDRMLPINEGNSRNEMTIGGQFPWHKKLLYFTSGEVLLRDHIEAWENPALKEWIDSTDKYKATWDNTYPDSMYPGKRGLAKGWSTTGLSNTDREYYSVQGKLTYKIRPGVKFDLGGFINRDQFGLEYDRYCTPRYRRSSFSKTNQLTLALTHDVTPSIFYTARVGHFHTNRVFGKRRYDTEQERKWWQDYEITPWWYDISYDKALTNYTAPGWNAMDEDSNYYYPYGVPDVFRLRWQGTWYERENEYYGAKLDLTSQVGTHHQTKFGLGGNYHPIVKLNRGLYISTSPSAAEQIVVDDSLRFYKDSKGDTVWYRYSDYGPLGDTVWVISEGERRLPRCLYFDEYKESPKDAYFYIQDKVEYPGFVLNAGVRVDWFDPSTWKMDNILAPRDSLGNQDTSRTPAKFQFSPRFGISFPVTDRTVFHLSYGHFFQMPKMSLLYDSYNNLYIPGARGAWGIVGSPNLEAEKTTQYEIGLGHQLGEDIALHLTAFYKDVYNLIGTRYVPAQPRGYSINMAEDYGNVWGVELGVEKRATAWLSGGITYTLSFAKGTSSWEREAYYDYIANVPVDPYTGEPFVLPKSVFPLEYDQRQVINTNLNLNIPEGVGLLENTNINLVTQIGSGLPWTERDTRDYLVGERNARRLPWSIGAYLKFRKDFKIYGQKFYLFAEIQNLFNFKNMLGVYEATGKTDDDGLFQDYETYIDQTFPKDYYNAGAIPSYGGQSWQQDDYPAADPRRDINGDGYITKQEWYDSYQSAYKDALSGYGFGFDGPAHGAGYGGKFSAPRKINIGFAFTW